ncbi:MAG: type II toxin-antitoxin system VapC family toxin [Deltaproteobacteria bacterium]|nr:type II toxin-antitoxin system VapC family toxin [Deltaproteobacteria bacterium]
MRICLDTSAYSHFKRGDGQAIEAIGSARLVCVPAIVLGELRSGFRTGRQAERNERELQEFLASSVVRVLDVDEECSHHYADIVAELQRAGTPVPTNDIWIAALATREGATVITYDSHFDCIRRVGSRILTES